MLPSPRGLFPWVWSFLDNGATMKCSFCEQPLVCKSCGKPFQPKKGETHLAIFQPDMEVACPECEEVLVCKACGYVFGSTEEEQE
jgi:DNA-directed RNA polymerase subunit RPC12/RpoP